MTRASKIIIGLGIFVAITPLLGFPGVVKDALIIIIGFGIAAITYWAEKHAKFCPECQLPSGTPHNHGENKEMDSSGVRNETTGVSPVQSSARVGSDMSPRDTQGAGVRDSVLYNLNSAPSPFSIDAQETKSKKVRARSEKRKTVVSG